VEHPEISKNKKPHSFEWGSSNLKLSPEKFKHNVPIQYPVDAVAVGVLCALNFS